MKLFRTLLVRTYLTFFAILFGCVGHVNAGYEAATAALQRGEYAEAYLLLQSCPKRETRCVRKSEELFAVSAEFLRRAKSGDADAQAIVGLMHEHKYDPPTWQRDFSLEWYELAAAGGSTVAMYRLGALYSGDTLQGLKEDARRGSEWLRRAAEKGYAPAQVALGVSYSRGRGVAKDEAKAVALYQMAARQCNATAQSNLGYSYVNGLGVTKDEKLAVAWYTKAADQEDQRAHNELGKMYAHGHGVTKSAEQAYFWGLLSVSGPMDFFRAKYLETVKLELSVSKVESINEAVKRWKPKSAIPCEADSAPNGGAVLPLAPQTAMPVSSGSGFAVLRNRVVTNAHVVEGCARISLAGFGPATVIAKDARSDLALLETAGQMPAATLRAGRLRQGDMVSVVGFPLRGILASGAGVTTGNVSALAGLQNDTRFIQISAPVQPGNSGGPLVDMSGNVVGVVVSKLDAQKIAQITGDIPQNVNFAVSPLILQGFLDANSVEYQSAPSTRTLAPADVADIAKKFTFLVECWK